MKNEDSFLSFINFLDNRAEFDKRLKDYKDKKSKAEAAEKKAINASPNTINKPKFHVELYNAHKLTKGPANIPLRAYKTEFDGNFVYISNF